MKTFEVFYPTGHSDFFLADFIEYFQGALLLYRNTYDIYNKFSGFYLYMIFAPGTWASAQEVEDEDMEGQEIQTDLEDRTVGKALSA